MILGFIGVAVFGFLAMGEHGPGHNFSGCIAALQGKADCSAFGGLVSFASFHLDAFKVFSSANFSAAIAALQGKADCSAFGGLVSFASFHLDAFKVFSSANFSAATAAFLAFFIAALVFSTASASRLFDLRFSKNTVSSAVTYSVGYGFYTPLEQNLKNWFALHENSPAIF
ncbi:MAG: hypothetical protein A3J46_01250 [Candidatus Yanofskybacteria bacterium RIFCSPHIGHO2_02_FULL_41_11]|uniref:Uncharacterized protein n=1 Tax=Candidatus Yanofskybacteria bacterium RIFCSPHIGHO2_02_FULL_41_11 TaxID=1802675 RepID=A0A1F8F8E1_9BACT|nr:MAG: hypothetical protein A3J46_01250 [Candidatus Yanofskybacteria bacterium RIFCSPHIGHO2_02_FULL_41_11]